MDPCPFVRIIVSDLSLKLPQNSPKTQSFHSEFKLKGFSAQSSELSLPENDAADSRIHACFSFSKAELEKRIADQKKSTKSSSLKIEVYCPAGFGRRRTSCVFASKKKLLGSFTVQLDFKSALEGINGIPTNSRSGCVVMQNGWVSLSANVSSGLKLHVNVRSEPDPRFVFEFGGEPECSPQVFQVNSNVKQPVFSCKFGIRNGGDMNLRSRSSLSEPSTISRSFCFGSTRSTSDEDDDYRSMKERKGWSVTIHDLSGSPVAAASMVTLFVPSPATDRVSKSNPGAWLILQPCNQTTWKPWGRLEAWREKDSLGYRFDLVPDESIDTIPLASSRVNTKTGGKFSIDITLSPTPSLASPNSSFDVSSGSELGSATSGSGSWWAHVLYRGFVMSSTAGGDRKSGRPVVEVGAEHVTCTEDAAAFVALAAAMDLSMDACKSFSRKLKKELRQPDPYLG